MINVFCWKWRQEYRHSFKSEYANVLERMVRRNYDGGLRFVTITDDPVGVDGETFPLWDDFSDLRNASSTTVGDLPSCYRRLKLFDPATQKALGVQGGDRIVSIDLDVVVVGNLNKLWDHDEPFIGWRARNKINGWSYNGSVWSLAPGAYPQVWSNFRPDWSTKIANRAGYNGSDQAWMSYVIGKQAAWTREDGIYTRMETMGAGKTEPPSNATLVSFHGRVKPWDAVAGEGPRWVERYWK